MALPSSSSRSGFRFKWLVIAGLIAAAGYYGYGKWGHGAAGGAPGAQGGAPVSIATVIAKPVTEWTEFSGILEAVHAVEVRPRISGQIMQVHFADGELVKKGQPLFTIDPRPYEAEVMRAKGTLASAQSAQANAATELARAKKLIKAKAISQSEYEARVSAFNVANGALATAQGAARAAELNLMYTHITAPISGKISRAEITEGNLVDAGGSAPLLASIVALSPIYASFDVDEQSFLRSIQGVPTAKLKTIPVEVGLGNAQGGAPLAATIHAFDNQIKPGSGTLRVRALLPNKDGSLVPGLYARVRLGTPEPTQAILIHPTAVGTDQSKKFVMRVGEGNKAEYRPVVLGGLVEGLQLVREGLAADDQIIVNGLQRVRPGAPISGTAVDMTTLKPLDAPAAEAPPTAETEAH